MVNDLIKRDFFYAVNKPLDLPWAALGSEDRSLINTVYKNDHPKDNKQISYLDKKAFTLRIRKTIYPVAITPDLPVGSFHVRELWEFPYWKSRSRFYYPSQNNPIGTGLVILYEPETGEKLNQGLHAWMEWEYETRKCSQGFDRRFLVHPVSSIQI